MAESLNPLFEIALTQAVAQAWTTPENQNKVMDPTLATAVVDALSCLPEIASILNPKPDPSPSISILPWPLDAPVAYTGESPLSFKNQVYVDKEPMMAEKIEWWCNKSIQKQGVEIMGYITSPPSQLNPLGQTSVMLPWSFQTLSDEDWQDMKMPVSPALLSKDSAQNLMDELWSCGIRPSNGVGNMGQLEAVQAHLKDMREITFDLLKLKA